MRYSVIPRAVEGIRPVGWLAIVCAAIAAGLFHLSGGGWLLWLSVASGIVALWSHGIMHNYAMKAAKQRPGFTGRFYDITEREAESVPNWLAAVNMFSSLVAFVLLVVGIYFYVTASA